jgi:Domain of unknown function (DUF5753)
VAYIEHVTDSLYIEAERDTFQYLNSFRRLNEAALDKKASRERLARARRDWELRKRSVHPSAS